MLNDKQVNYSFVLECNSEQIELQLARILASPQFKFAHQMQRFLGYIIDKVLLGEEKELKQYSIAVDALGFADDFDSDSNPVVRIMGGRVRERLNKYYQEEGKDDPLIISIPKGSYVPLIKKRKTTPELKSVDFRGSVSQGPKLGLFCFEDNLQSKDSNLLAVHIASTLAKELSHYLLSRLYVKIPYQGDNRSELTGLGAKNNYNLDFSLLLFVQELPDNKYELVYRLWDNESEEVIASEIFNVSRGQVEEEQREILNKIMAEVTDFYQGKEQVFWARKLLQNNEEAIPENYQALVFYRFYADSLVRSSFQKGVYYCQKALERKPQDVIANVIFADYCRRDYAFCFGVIENGLEKGKESAKIAINLRPDSHEARYVLGQILFCMNEWEQSKREFKQVRKLCQNYNVIEYGIGFHYCLMGDWGEGLDLVENAMSLSDSYPTWFHVTPFLDFYNRKEYKHALVEALKIVTPNLLYAPVARCVAYGKLGKKKKAHKELKNILRIAPDFLESGKTLLLHFLGSEKLAEKVWKEVIKGVKHKPE